MTKYVDNVLIWHEAELFPTIFNLFFQILH